MRIRTRQVIGILVVGVLIAGVATAGAQTDAQMSKVQRWESNLSLGGTSNDRMGLMKTVWWFALPKVLAVGMGFDCIFEEPMWFSANVALNAPVPVVVPFVVAGAGASLSGTTISQYGGGLKVRLTGKLGLLAEYRHSRYTHMSAQTRIKEAISAHYFGAGIFWFY